MQIKNTISVLVVGIMLILVHASSTLSGNDPEPLDDFVYKMHYPQYPDPAGWDVLDHYEYGFSSIADDWLCTENGTVDNIHFWGSWYGDQMGLINGFMITIHADIPAGEQANWSMPGEILWSKYIPIFNYTLYTTELQGWYEPPDYFEPGNHINCWYYNITNISDPFIQTNGTIYWLNISADVEEITGWWGWKSSIDHWNDDAVFWNYASMQWEELKDPMTNESMDMSFIIEGEPLEYGDPTEFPNAKMHYPQYPDPYGWDVNWINYYLADDWMCNFTGNVTDIHFWVSSYNDSFTYEDIYDKFANTISPIYLAIWSNNDSYPSHPQEPLYIGQPAMGMCNIDISGPYYGDEGWYYPYFPSYHEEHNHEQFWRIDYTNFTDPFVQENGTIYWLSIYDDEGAINELGWKTSTDHFMDTAVFGQYEDWYSIYDPINVTDPIDFAFVITGEPLEYGDPIEFPDAKMTNPQYPDPFGWDTSWEEWELADDWQCSQSGNVTDIHFWVSSYNDTYDYYGILDAFTSNAVGNRFYMYIYSNEPGPPSQPNETLWSGIPASGICDIEVSGPFYGNEGWFSPPSYYEEDNHQLFWRIDYTNFTDPFVQIKDEIYWLGLFHSEWSEYHDIGWKTTQDHFMDNAMVYVDGWWELFDPINISEPIDFAFVITGEPLPNMPPDIPTNENPVNNSDYVTINSYLSVDVSDPNGDPMDVVFYWGNGTEIGIATGVASGGTASIYLPDYIWMSHNTNYSWYVEVYDPSYLMNISEIWNFTTCETYDLNGDGNINYLDVSLLVSHYGQSIPDATQTIKLRPIVDTVVLWSTSPPIPNHFMCVFEIIPDEVNTFVFENPPAIGSELFFVNAPSYTYTIDTVTLYARMSSTIGGGVDVFTHVIWDGVNPPSLDIPVAIMPSFPIFQSYSSSIWIGDPYGGQWTWAKLQNYHFGVDQSGLPFVSTTMMTQFYLDIHYTTPGSEAYDINDDQIVNYLDVSTMVYHYGESY